MATIRKELPHIVGSGYKGMFGLEIETEVYCFSDYDGKISIDSETDEFIIDSMYWGAVRDNSLRNFGVEFVLHQPLDFPDILKAVEEFYTLFGSVPFIKDAPSTSIHVHVNTLDMTLIELANFITTYSLLENVLIGYCGESRYSNLFALPIRCSEDTYKNVVKMFGLLTSANPHAMNFSSDYVKYAALNLATIHRYGSLEIRSMRGTTDPLEILEWVGMIDNIVKYSKSVKDPNEVLADFKSLGVEFITKALGESVGGIHRAEMFDIELLEKNVWYAYSIATSVSDWSVLEAPFTKGTPKRSPKNRPNPWSQGMSGDSVETLVDALLTPLQAAPYTMDPVVNFYEDGEEGV